MLAEADQIEAESSTVTAPKGAKARLRTLDDLDRRTKAAQATFELRDQLASDLGGMEQLSAMEREIVDGAALLGAMIKDAGATYLSGDPVDLGEFMALTNAQRRLLADVGLQRRARDVTPTLQDIIAGRAA
ncbi:hypothetical protein [Mesorhizobium sp. B2-3-15]|uniref:hypothetical protein n=1 Tax=Mesorhizobium sp. B2-3-15 TaxID=2589949 RepID=UPI00112C40F2|nr:hypothetical protein [Mesorhizobium sp. B2-3-15]TPL75115.1 hypothetical protein FJ954_09160 [Mesorhizobium sp. B2-3-15]